MPSDNIAAVFTKFAKQINLPLNESEIYDELLIHPEYPSLLAISDILKAFNIENAAYHVKKDDLLEVPVPFIAQTFLNNGEFLLVSKFDNETVTVSNEKWDHHKLSKEYFLNIFKGVVLIAEHDMAISHGRSLKNTIDDLKLPLTIAGLSLILFSSLIFHTDYFTTLNWQIAILTIFKSAGLITSVLLLVQSIDNNNPLVQKLCQAEGNSDCNAILSSKAASVFEGLTWSEVGFFYFAGTWLLLLFSGSTIVVWQLLALLNITSLPYTFYSIYYQARIVKQWCVLCCTVQALLWLEFIPLITGLHTPFILPAPGALSSLFIALLLPIVFWVLLKPLLLRAQQLRPLKQQLQQAKFNTSVFNNLLTAQHRYAEPEEEWSIVLGSKEASNVITMVTNPYCPPCAKTHKLLHELLEKRENVQARIVFTADNSDNDIKTPVSRHLMTLHGLPDKTLVTQALYDWYEQKQKNYDDWAKAYPVYLNEVEYNKINKQKAWCEMVEVTATPTVLLNGYRLPDLYQLTDLKYMLT